MSRLVVLALILLPSLHALAQKDSSRVERIGVSYFAEGGVYPGFMLNYERKLLSNNSFQLLLAGKVGAYFHRQNHTGMFLMVQSGQRFKLHKQLYFEHFLGIGYLHSFLNGGDSYYVNASGQVQKAGDAGDPHFMPSISVGLSYDHKGKHPVMLVARPMLFWQIPFNQVSLLQYGFEFGALFKVRSKK